MKTVTAATELEGTAHAITQVIRDLNEAGDAPKLIKVSYTEHHDPKVIADRLKKAFPETEIIGGSTHAGLFTESGVFGFGKPALGAFGVWDNEADIGVAMEPVADGMHADETVRALTRAIDRAQDDADRVGELPDLIWVYISPGLEETAIATIKDTFGDGVSVVGMSVADNAMTANWSMFDKAGVASSGIGIVLFYTTEAVSHYIQSGFMPAGQSGIVTEAEGRRLISIDGRPAREVFEDWCGQALVTETGQLNYEELGLKSLAHRVGEKRMSNGAVIEDYYLMSPVSSDGHDLTLVASPLEGEAVYLMHGDRDSVHNRLRTVTQKTFKKSSDFGDRAGGLMVMCAGYAFALQEDVLISIKSLIETFDGVPTLGTIAFGEQGTFPNGKCIHGNWMVSSTILSA